MRTAQLMQLVERLLDCIGRFRQVETALWLCTQSDEEEDHSGDRD